MQLNNDNPTIPKEEKQEGFGFLKGKDTKKLLLDGGLYLVLLILIAGIIIKEPSFLSFRNMRNILTQSSVRTILALGVAGIIVTQGTDLSVGRQVGLSAVISATLLQAMTNVNKVFPNLDTLPIPVVILIVCVIGGFAGFLNGFVVAYLNVTPFVATLGSMIIIYGANSLYYDYVGASPIAGFSKSFTNFAQGYFTIGGFRFNYLIIYALLALLFIWILWNKTTFGKNLFAVGGNPEAAKVSGVNVKKTLVLVYTLSGIFYAFGGMLEAGRVGSATNNLGNMYEMDAIAACVVGGVSFSGGVGTVPGVLIGVIIFTVINYGLTFIGVNPYWQYIIKGVIIVMAVALDTLKYVKKK
ncbi:galactose/methyl galactoside ABC transporter permease MglC [Cetobacterium sp.]|uniref:galactose/methyl galactoside ABC transporter permease MglC n=1 Tax=Cetobacterium sp. TaxID=2071632 RepID=UPI002FCA4761